MSKIGFTGTRAEITFNQKMGIASILAKNLEKVSINEFRHGQCVGADCYVAAVAKNLTYKVIAYPGFPGGNRADRQYRGKFNKNDVVMAEEEFFTRNRLIVLASDLMIATPKESYETLRSGTWATVRFATKKGKHLIVVLPNGQMKEYNGK
jgi:hypothetical protein